VPLPRERRARFHDEMRPIGRALGIPDALLPRDVDAFDAYVAGMLAPGGPIRVTPTARSHAPVVLRPPLGPAARAFGRLGEAAAPIADAVPAATYAWTMVPAVGLLPARVRDDYGLAWGLRERAFASWLVWTWRAWAGLLPAGFRQMPQALAADRRAATLVAASPTPCQIDSGGRSDQAPVRRQTAARLRPRRRRWPSRPVASIWQGSMRSPRQ
jgi:uncharacterized protein (DUF2236 family)